MPQAKIRSRLPRCSTPAVSHRAGLSVCVRPNAQIVPPSGLHDMRIAPRECLPQLEQMIDPPPPVTRWTSRRKAAVVAAVHSGEITLEAACGRYELSRQHFLNFLPLPQGQRSFRPTPLNGFARRWLRARLASASRRHRCWSSRYCVVKQYHPDNSSCLGKSSAGRDL